MLSRGTHRGEESEGAWRALSTRTRPLRRGDGRTWERGRAVGPHISPSPEAACGPVARACLLEPQEKRRLLLGLGLRLQGALPVPAGWHPGAPVTQLSHTQGEMPQQWVN